MSRFSTSILPLGLGLLALTGCLFGAAGPKAPTYQWGIWNASGFWYGPKTKVTYTGSDGKERRLASGTNGPGAYETRSPGPRPVPKLVHVHIDRASFDDFRKGEEIDVDLKVDENIPDETHFSGTVWVVVTKDGVYLGPETEGEQKVRGALDRRDNVAWDKGHVPTTSPSEKTTPDNPAATSQP